MRIDNTTAGDITLNYRTGRSVVVPAGKYVIRDASELDLIDDTAVTLARFASGDLVLKNDDGSAWTGAALPSAPKVPVAPQPLMVSTSSDGKVNFRVGVKPFRGPADFANRNVVMDFVGGTATIQGGIAGTSVALRPGEFEMVASSTDAATCAYYYTPPAPVSLHGCKTIEIPIYVSGFWKDNIAIWFYQKGVDTSARCQIPMSLMRPNAWNMISISRDTPILTNPAVFDADQVEKITVSITTPAGMSASAADRTIKLGPISADSGKKGRIVWYCDGNYISQKTMILPAMERRGIRCGMALFNAAIGAGASYMTEADILATASRGHIPIHHTYANKTGGYGNASDWPSEDSIYNDIMSAWSWMDARGLRDGIGHAVMGFVAYWDTLTSAARNKIIRSAMDRAGVKSLRTGGTWNAASAGNVGGTTPPRIPDSDGFMRIFGGSIVTASTTADNLKAIIDAVIDRGEVAGITFHHACIDSDTPSGNMMKIGDIMQVLNYARDKERDGLLLNQDPVTAYNDIAALSV